MSGREPVRPHDTGREGNDDGREMCEVNEEDGDMFGYKTTEHEWKHELTRDGADHEEDAFDRMMRPFNPDVEESDEGDAIAENHGKPKSKALYRK